MLVSLPKKRLVSKIIHPLYTILSVIRDTIKLRQDPSKEASVCLVNISIFTSFPYKGVPCNTGYCIFSSLTSFSCPRNVVNDACTTSGYFSGNAAWRVAARDAMAERSGWAKLFSISPPTGCCFCFVLASCPLTRQTWTQSDSLSDTVLCSVPSAFA